MSAAEDPSFDATGTRGSVASTGFRFGEGAVLSGRYRIVRPLSRGGMGEVYEADDAQLLERIALKILAADLAVDAAALARFQGEVKSARRISHPNVCRLFDSGVHDEGTGPVYFLTMELLAGPTLMARLAGGRPSREETIDLMQQIAAGLDAAHAVGVVHRDLKPSNVMLVPLPDGGVRAVITDFGIARRLDEPTVTRGGFVGTPAYIAPEQLEGQKAGPAADVYSLGVIFFEAATGSLPFLGDGAIEVAVQRLSRPPPTAGEVDPSVPAAWSAAIARCLERRPEDRWLLASDALAAIGGRRVVSPPRRSRRGQRRLVVGVALLALIGTVIGWSTRSPLPARARIVVLTTEMAQGVEPLPMPEGLPAFTESVADVIRSEWRTLEDRRRFRFSNDGRGNVVARLAWKPEADGLSAVLELGAGDQILRRVEARAGNAQVLARQLYPALSEVVGDGQPPVELFPEEIDEAALLKAPSPSAYKGLIAWYDAYYATTETDAEQLQSELQQLMAHYPQWAHPPALDVVLKGAMSPEGRALAARYLAMTWRDDPVGVELLRAISLGQTAHDLARLDSRDRVVAAVVMSSYASVGLDEFSALEREIGMRYPHTQFPAFMIGIAIGDLRRDEAMRGTAEWLRRAPGQKQAWLTRLVVESVLEGQPLRSRQLELLFEFDKAMLLSVTNLYLCAGDADRAEELARRVLSAGPRQRAVAQSLLGLVAIKRGELVRAYERLGLGWTTAKESKVRIDFQWTQVARELARVATLLGRADEARVWRARQIEAWNEFGWPAAVVAAVTYENLAEPTCPELAPLIAAAPAAEQDDAKRFLHRAAQKRGCATCAQVLALGLSPRESLLLPWTQEYFSCAVSEAADVDGAIAIARDAVHLRLTWATMNFDASVVDVVMMQYWLARLLEKKGQTTEARAEYARFLERWGRVELPVPEVADAKARMKRAP